MYLPDHGNVPVLQLSLQLALHDIILANGVDSMVDFVVRAILVVALFVDVWLLVNVGHGSVEEGGWGIWMLLLGLIYRTGAPGYSQRDPWANLGLNCKFDPRAGNPKLRELRTG